MIYIEEIVKRSNQGVTRPFLCRGSDGFFYYVKGACAGHRSLICEWMSGSLASAFGLNVPFFDIAIIPDGLADFHPEGGDLGRGPVFASRQALNVNEIRFSERGRVPREVRRDLIVFDWWIRNGDRSLTENGGNPNLLWDSSSGKLVVIDHNQAFDDDFEEDPFFSTHVFKDEWNSLCSDLVVVSQYMWRIRQALGRWDEAWELVPGEWLFHDAERTIPTNFDPASVKALLDRCCEEHQWRML